MHRDSGFVGRLEVMDSGRRRRWSVEEKIRIVEESLSGHRQASATARRHGIPVGLLFRWRKEYRAGFLDRAAASAFAAAVIATPASVRAPGGACSDGRMEIMLPDGTCIAIAADVDADALGRVLAVLERRRRLPSVRIFGCDWRAGRRTCGAACTAWRCRSRKG